MKHLVCGLVLIILYTKSVGQIKIEDTYNKKLTIGNIPNISSFIKLTDLENRLLEINNEYDHEIDSLLKLDSFKNLPMTEYTRMKNFIDNRSRSFITPFVNNKQQKLEKEMEEGVSADCSCIINNDTLVIATGFGVFGGETFLAKITGNTFLASHYVFDEVGGYTLNINNKVLADHLYIPIKYQNLILNTQPTFADGQKLTGLLTYTTHNYYNKRNGKIDICYSRNKMYFTCITRLSNENIH